MPRPEQRDYAALIVAVCVLGAMAIVMVQVIFGGLMR